MNEIDWSKYPRLRTMYEHRPTINVWWEELCRLATELVAKGYAETPARDLLAGQAESEQGSAESRRRQR